MAYRPKNCSIRLHRKLCRCHHRHPLGYLDNHPHRSLSWSMKSIPNHLLSRGRRHQRHHRCRHLCLPSHPDNHLHHGRSASLKSTPVVHECIDRIYRESNRYHRHHRRHHPWNRCQNWLAVGLLCWGNCRLRRPRRRRLHRYMDRFERPHLDHYRHSRDVRLVQPPIP